MSAYDSAAHHEWTPDERKAMEEAARPAIVTPAMMRAMQNYVPAWQIEADRLAYIARVQEAGGERAYSAGLTARIAAARAQQGSGNPAE